MWLMINDINKFNHKKLKNNGKAYLSALSDCDQVRNAVFRCSRGR